MKHWIEHGLDGLVYFAGSSPDLPTPAREDGVVVEVERPLDPLRTFWVNSEALDIGPKPSPLHTLDVARRAWVITTEAQWAEVRARRAALLAASDWVVLRAYEQSTPVPPEWLAYRQALRDITEQGDPAGVVWPNAPGV